MIDRDKARNQIKRLSGLSFYPQSVEGMRELIDMLVQADDADMAEETVSEFLYTAKECPSPAELARIMANLRARRQPDGWCPPSSQCACQGRRWIITRDKNGNEGAAMCSCHAARAKAS